MIYPAKTKEADFLDQYVKHFNSIELNAVFYSIPNAELAFRFGDVMYINSQSREFAALLHRLQSIPAELLRGYLLGLTQQPILSLPHKT